MTPCSLSTTDIQYAILQGYLSLINMTIIGLDSYTVKSYNPEVCIYLCYRTNRRSNKLKKLLCGLCKACMSRTGAKCSNFNTTKGAIKCNARCTTKACQECKIARKIAKQNCQECYNERNADCTHTDSERAITGLWTTAEMEKALEKGYKIVTIYDVWHFKQSSTEL